MRSGCATACGRRGITRILSGCAARDRRSTGCGSGRCWNAPRRSGCSRRWPARSPCKAWSCRILEVSQSAPLSFPARCSVTIAFHSTRTSMHMNWADYLILAIIAISALISLVRGFVREVISIVTWIAAFWLAIVFARPFAGVLARYIDSPLLQLITAFALIFVATLLAGAIIGYLAGQLVGKTGLTGTDRAVGMLFGAGRGLILVALLILALGLTRLPQEQWWRQSLVIGQLQPWVCEVAASEWMRGLTVYAPVSPQGVPMAVGRSAADYWSDFCDSAGDQ